MREFTIEELSKYRDGDKIYLALGGKVYDVTKSAMFYGPGGAYHVFAGRDGTVIIVFAQEIFTLKHTLKNSFQRSCDVRSRSCALFATSR